MQAKAEGPYRSAHPTQNFAEARDSLSPDLRPIFDSLCEDVMVPSRVVLEFGDAISGISRVSGQAARSIG
jgi:hypothetical protein